SFIRSTTATGSSGDLLWKNSARTYVRRSRNVDRTGTSRRPNSKPHGSRAARNSSIRTAKHTSKRLVNRIRRHQLHCVEEPSLNPARQVRYWASRHLQSSETKRRSTRKEGRCHHSYR